MNINYITGYAGTGKSTKLLELLKTVNPDTTIVLCPTHKAIRRLFSEAFNTGIEMKTMHSMLGWVPSINESAEHINHIDITIKLDKEIEAYTHIILDEGGMVSEDMFMELVSKIESVHNFETDDIVIDVFLDPYQLLPVKGKQIQLDPDTTTNLITQHRAESVDIVKTFTKFVTYLQGLNLDLTIKASDNIIFTNSSIKGFKEGDRFLCYTNEKVGQMNNLIAKELGINSYIGQEVQLGNMLDTVIVEEFYEPTIEELMMAYESGALLLQNRQISSKFLEQSLKALIDHKDIQFIISDDRVIPVILGIDKANIVLKNAKARAVENKSMFKWVYALGRAFIMDYTFASTIHKAQGSEFDRVWISKSDIQKSIMNDYYGTYARLMYVAISRAKKSLFIYD